MKSLAVNTLRSHWYSFQKSQKAKKRKSM